MPGDSMVEGFGQPERDERNITNPQGAVRILLEKPRPSSRFFYRATDLIGK
jgi:hypothetical protein